MASVMAGQLQVVDAVGATGDGAAIATALLAWYDRHRRDLPWRAAPGTPADPYLVWLSEIMLQQTTVATVGPYFHRFVERWPGIADLAAASLDDVLKEWAGLGYYARARKLHQCAVTVVRDLGGRFPRDEAALMALPGIGPYTAGAIAAIAFGLPAVAVDGNVERVIARLYAIETPLPAAKPEIRARAARLVPAERTGDFTQGLMDLGASVCAPRRADCPICPLAGPCVARVRGMADALPRRAARKARPVRHGTAFVAMRADGAVLLRRRPEKGLLGGMMEVPSGAWLEDAQSAAAAAPLAADWQPHSAIVEHTFTHFHLVLRLMTAVVPMATAAPDKARFVPLSRLGGEALPSLMRKVISAVLGPDAVRRRPVRRAPAGAGDRSA
jgi:A/G-specific adenine glycosylase